MDERKSLLSSYAPSPSMSQSQSTRIPQCIAHRGYKAQFPENSIKAFSGALAAGAHAIETDVQITNDGIIVLSHDPTLARCFGRDEKIADVTWEFIRPLRSLEDTSVGMPRLYDLLSWLAEDRARDDAWVLLDIKVENDADTVMRLIRDTIRSFESRALLPRLWKERIVLGIWAPEYLPLCARYLDGYQITHIGFDIRYAREFQKVKGVGFNLLQRVLASDAGERFVKEVQGEGRKIFVWTVNDEQGMKWSLRNEVDGVVTDDVAKWFEAVNAWDEEDASRVVVKRNYTELALLWVLVRLFSFLFRCRYGFRVDARKMEIAMDRARLEAKEEAELERKA